MLHNILWAVVILLVILWLFGLMFRIGRCFIHVLLAIAVILLLYNLFFVGISLF
jgi:hypothetical protein